MEENEISTKIIGAAIEVHRQLGPGLFENSYRQCLHHELKSRGLSVSNGVPVPIIYKGEKLDAGYHLDLLVEDKVIVEVLAAEAKTKVHFTELLTYLKLKDKKLGLLINFNTHLLKDGIQRVVNNL
ncbi:MAG: GxxExxY protein [Saprospirales bacterium]|nr:MAG: GxxExxY protein [Saprospirales bacterium]